jgi:hypothetical protein
MRFCGLLMAAAMAAPSAASAVGLFVGDGDGALALDVDAFGGSRTAFYDPIGPIGSADVFFDSYVALSGPSGFRELDDFDIAPTIIAQTDRTLQSTFTINQLQFTLTQTVAQTLVDGAVAGAALTQSYEVTNLASVGNSFSLRRYLDADLDFDGDLIDGGGALTGLGGRTLFQIETFVGEGGVTEDFDGDGPIEVDAPVFEAPVFDESDDLSGTTVAITASGGMIPTAGAFEVSACCDAALFSPTLTDDVENDFDGDGVIDEPYDVALNLQNDFMLGAGETALYVTQTLFGEATPTPPGSTPATPLLPTETTVDGFAFVVPSDAIIEREIFFIDPEVAVGYTYAVEGGSSFSSALVPEQGLGDDMFTLTANGVAFALATGQEFVFADFLAGPVTTFTITGIDPALALDPDNPVAFVTGVALQDVPVDVDQRVTQNPIVIDTDVAPIPLPAAGWLLLAGCGALGAVRARRAAG